MEDSVRCIVAASHNFSIFCFLSLHLLLWIDSFPFVLSHFYHFQWNAQKLSAFVPTQCSILLFWRQLSFLLMQSVCLCVKLSANAHFYSTFLSFNFTIIIFSKVPSLSILPIAEMRLPNSKMKLIKKKDMFENYYRLLPSRIVRLPFLSFFPRVCWLAQWFSTPF